MLATSFSFIPLVNLWWMVLNFVQLNWAILLLFIGAKYAFNPKDMNLSRNSSSTSTAGKLTEKEIKDRINRLPLILANKVVVSKLPDKGDNLHKQIAELKVELEMIHMEKKKKEKRRK